MGAASNDGGGANSVAVYVVQGPVNGAYSLADADIKYIGESAGDKLGTSVSPAGDIDGAGIQDFVVGAVFDDAAGVDCGAAYVVLGDMASAGGEGAPPMLTTLSVCGAGDAALAGATAAPGAASRGVGCAGSPSTSTRGELQETCEGLIALHGITILDSTIPVHAI